MSIKTSLLVFVLSLFFTLQNHAQNSPFEIKLKPIKIAELGGLQSYAYGQSDGKWLIVGGRLDGLHRRQPWAAFDKAGHNNQLIVIDPVAKKKWTKSITTLSQPIQEQLRSTNMQFAQEGDYLYCVGGYGFSDTEKDHTTFPYLTAINVPKVIDAVVNNRRDISPYFKQIEDSKLQVTGGRLRKLNDTYYLMGGHKFIGRYNPMGPDNGPGFIQEYTDAVRIFNIATSNGVPEVKHIKSYTDTDNLHRRDYNAEPQIMPNGKEGLTLFSGVFQKKVNLPFLTAVNIDANGYSVQENFKQYYNHYHCAVVPLYSASKNEMHNVFFGGIAQYYDNNGTLTQDENVPFVTTIARVTRNESGSMAEYKLPIEMPALLGAGAEFIPNLKVPHYKNDVLKLDEFRSKETLVGYIYGGISSTAANIFFTNNGTQSAASSQIFEVYVVNTSLGVDALNTQSISPLNILVYPNPNKGEFVVTFNLLKTSDVFVTLKDIKGAIVLNTVYKNQSVGKHSVSEKVDALNGSGVYFLTLTTSDEKHTLKIILEN